MKKIMETAITRRESLIARRLVIMSLIKEYEAKGLGNCQNVATLKQELGQITFDRYKDEYPSYLFFTDGQFDAIVKGDNLVVSNIEAYRGHIPDECFNAVKNENINKEDLRESIYTVEIKSSRTGNGFTIRGVNSKKLERIKSSRRELEIEIGKTSFRGRHYMGHEVNELLYGEDYYILGSFSKDARLKETEINIAATTDKDYGGLYIACPESMIDKSKQKRKITEYFKIKGQAPKDPIVFRYVKDGVLAITSWK
jgi:hypothetical protein